jgi:hypothetical protein
MSTFASRHFDGRQDFFRHDGNRHRHVAPRQTLNRNETVFFFSSSKYLLAKKMQFMMYKNTGAAVTTDLMAKVESILFNIFFLVKKIKVSRLSNDARLGFSAQS